MSKKITKKQAKQTKKQQAKKIKKQQAKKQQAKKQAKKQSNVHVIDFDDPNTFQYECEGCGKEVDCDPTLYLCRCDCGNEMTVSAGDLRSGRVTSCGRCPDLQKDEKKDDKKDEKN